MLPDNKNGKRLSGANFRRNSERKFRRCLQKEWKSPGMQPEKAKHPERVPEKVHEQGSCIQETETTREPCCREQQHLTSNGRIVASDKYGNHGVNQIQYPARDTIFWISGASASSLTVFFGTGECNRKFRKENVEDIPGVSKLQYCPPTVFDGIALQKRCLHLCEK